MKRKLSKSEVSQTFNLKSLLGYEPSARQKEAFFDLALEEIVDRTINGKDINKRKFTQYSEKYAAQKGVPRSSVDLVLNGDMLNSFDESQTKQKNIVKIKMQEGIETLKSFNHTTGDTLPKRDFFGFKSEKDLAPILKKVDELKNRNVLKEDVGISDLAALRAAINEITLERE